MNRSLRLLLCTVALTPLASGAAQAQSATSPADQAQAAPERDDNADIIVTARRTEENAQVVPISITALSGTQLLQRGVSRLEDLRLTIPSLQLSTVNGRDSTLRPTLRSQAQLDVVVTQDGAVGTYFDEIYQGRPSALGGAFVDIQSVQALKGPQGTLFGRNTTGGAMVITSNRPNTDRVEGYVRTYAGDYDAFGIQGAVNIPLSDSVAIRLAGSRDVRDGYSTNLTTGLSAGNRNDYSLRGSLLLRLGENIENVTIVGYYENNSRSPGNYITTVVLPGSQAAAFGFSADITAALARQQARSRFDVENNVAGEGYARNLSITNLTKIELGSVTLRNIFGYREVASRDILDLDATALQIISTDQFVDVHQFSNEVLLSGTAFADRLNWTTGGIYFVESGADFSNTNINRGIILQHGGAEDSRNRSIGLFAQGSYRVTDALTFTLGGRYTWDRRSVTISPTQQVNGGAVTCGVTQPNPAGPVPARTPIPLAQCNLTASRSFEGVSYSVGLDYRLTPDNLLYVAHRRSYRTGGLNQRAALLEDFRTGFEPETVRDLEIGTKNDFHFASGGQLRINLAGYYVWYDDIQRLVQQFQNNTLFNTIVNAASASIKGVEAEILWRPSPAFSLGASFAHSRATYNGFVATTSAGPVDLSANRFANAPVDSGTIYARLAPDLGWSAGRPFIGVDFYAQSSIENTDINAIGGHIPGYQVFNGQIGIERIGGRDLSATLSVRNLFDERYDVGALAFTPGSRSPNANQLGFAFGSPGAPRTVQVALRYGF